MAPDTRRRGIRGTAGDLKPEPGGAMLDRLVEGGIPASQGQDPKPPKGFRDKSTNGQKPTNGGTKVKVAFYLSPELRDQLDLVLAQARRHVGKREGRRLDQSALVRCVLQEVFEDFAKHEKDGQLALLVQWLQAQQD